jgi:hypothetical protein
MALESIFLISIDFCHIMNMNDSTYNLIDTVNIYLESKYKTPRSKYFNLMDIMNMYLTSKCQFTGSKYLPLIDIINMYLEYMYYKSSKSTYFNLGEFLALYDLNFLWNSTMFLTIPNMNWMICNMMIPGGLQSST